MKFVEILENKLDTKTQKYLDYVKTEMKKISPLLNVSYPLSGYDKEFISIKNRKQANYGPDIAKKIELFINKYKLHASGAYGTTRGKLEVKDDEYKINIKPFVDDGIGKKLKL